MIERKTTNRVLAGAFALIGLPLLYLISSGPVYGIFVATGQPDCLVGPISAIYGPMEALPDGIRKPIGLWMYLWVEAGGKVGGDGFHAPE